MGEDTRLAVRVGAADFGRFISISPPPLCLGAETELKQPGADEVLLENVPTGAGFVRIRIGEREGCGKSE